MEKIEIWKDIPGYDGIYQVSNTAIVRSLRFNKIKILTPQSSKYFKYLSVSLGTTKKFFIHRLVLCSFTEKPLDHPLQVNHIDENRLNNCLENLEWLTGIENRRHNNGYARRRATWNKGKPIILQKTLSGDLVKKWESRSQAKLVGYSPREILRCMKGDQRKHKGYLWEAEK